MGLASKLAAAQAADAAAPQGGAAPPGSGGYPAPSGAPPAGYAPPAPGNYGAPAGAPPAFQQQPYQQQFQQPYQPQFQQQPYQQAPGSGGAYGSPSGPPPSFAHQQQQQRPAAPARPAGPDPLIDWKQLNMQLTECVRDQKIKAFYPKPDAVEKIAKELAAKKTVRLLADKWQIPNDIAIGFAKMALFDYVLYVDDSGSMNLDGRKDELISTLEYVTDAAARFDSDGIQVRFMNSNLEGNNIFDPTRVRALIDKIPFKYQTPLATNLESRILVPIVLDRAKRGLFGGKLKKPVVIVTLTDGEPNGEARGKTLQSVIRDCDAKLAKTPYGTDAVSYQLAQIGNDPAATAYLQNVDNDPVIGDRVDATSNFEGESEECARKGVNLTRPLWIAKLLLGPIDSSYDAADE